MQTVKIIYEDNEILIINKKEGDPVQGGVNISHSVDETLSAQVGYKVHLVHRLDKETSGLLVVAKNPSAASKWTNMIGRKEVVKEYYAVCTGVPFVNGKPCLKGKLTDIVIAHGRKQDASLTYEVVKTEKVIVEKEGEVLEIELSLIHIVLGTGRMHQIRIQFAKAGAPLVQDDKHGDFKINKLLRKAGIKKMCLTAARLTVPLSEGNRVFEVPLPEYFPVKIF